LRHSFQVLGFIEKYLNSWPDHGDGSFEIFLVVLVVSLIAVLGLGFFRKLRD